jgi:hypothetical protein
LKQIVCSLLLILVCALPSSAQEITPDGAARLRTLIDELSRPVGPVVVNVPADPQALHTALKEAKPGTVLQLTNATYVGNFALAVANTQDVVVRGPALLHSPSNAPALSVLPYASHYRIEQISVSAASYGDLIRCGSAEQTADQMPHHIAFDGVQVLGNLAYGAKRGIALNCNHATVTNSIIGEIKGMGQDTQAIAIWNAVGPFTITNNTLIAAGENLMVGGADPSIPGLIPADFLIDGNRFIKPIEWRDTTWTVKNLLEFKFGKRATITNNTFDGVWPPGQDGFAIVFKSTNQDNTMPWAETSEIEFAHNTLRNISGGFKIAGKPEKNEAVRASKFYIHHNHITTDATLGGTGRCLQVMGVAEVRFEFNDCRTTGTIAIYLTEVGLNPGLTIVGNILLDRAYGIKGDGKGEGASTLAYYAPDVVFERNLIVSSQPASYAADKNRVVTTLPTDTTGYGVKQ